MTFIQIRRTRNFKHILENQCVNQKNSQIFCADLKNCQEVESLIKEILVPFDDSGHSERAFTYGLDLAKKYDARLNLVTIVSNNSITSLDIQHQTSIDKEKIKHLKKIFESPQSISKKFGVSSRSEIVVSSGILDAILSYTSSYKIDLIVMGSRGRIGPNQLMLGSIALGVSKAAPCPVVLIK